MIKEGKVIFKFRSEKDADEVSFPGTSIGIEALKSIIEEKKNSIINRKKKWR